VIKDRETILASRWLRPFAHLLGHPSLWHLNRRSVPRGLALGLFAAFILPIGQFALAALLAIPVRANVPLAAAATLVTNPFTFPPIYYAAYRLGHAMLFEPAAENASHVDTSFGVQLLQVSGPTALGLLLFAVSAASAGYVLGTLWWRARIMQRWRNRPGRAG
jgi:uncharacterized protein